MLHACTAYVSIRQHTYTCATYASFRVLPRCRTPVQHTSAYVSTRIRMLRMPRLESSRDAARLYSIRQHPAEYVSIRFESSLSSRTHACTQPPSPHTPHTRTHAHTHTCSKGLLTLNSERAIRVYRSLSY
jgi:hypothetical protein